MKQVIAVLLHVLSLCVWASPSLAGPSKSVEITEFNKHKFWDYTNNKGKSVACYENNQKVLPGKKKIKALDSGSKQLWKNSYKLKIKKLKVQKKNTKKAKKALKKARKGCKDNKPQAAPTPTPTPTPTPVPPPVPQIACGNGIREAAEICDDGNLVSEDGCSASCTNELCGNGVINVSLGEECDDGNALLGDGCSASCSVEGPVLVPGTGFQGATSEPGAVGDPASPGYNAKAIARWNVVPYQTFYQEMNVGVVAFHREGIARVEMSVNGGDWSQLTEMGINPSSGTTEYWAKLRAEDFQDGLVEVRAIAYPNIGQPRLLESLYLNANGSQSLPSLVRYVSSSIGDDQTGDGSVVYPYASILKAMNEIKVASGNGNADGGAVYLLAGSYSLGAFDPNLEAETVNRWVTVRPAPGVAKSEVTISASNDGGVGTKLLKLEEVRITSEMKSIADAEDYLWISNSSLVGLGRDLIVGDNGFISASSGWSEVFMTDSELSDHKDGVPVKLMRNVTLTNLGSDAFKGVQMAINSTVSGIDASGTDYVPDMFEFDLNAQSIENRIFYGVAGYNIGANGISISGTGTLKDIAFVNILHDFQPYEFISSGNISSGTLDHILFWHVTSMQDLAWGIASGNLSNISIKNSIWLGFEHFGSASAQVLDSHEVSENHFIVGDELHFVPGSNSTTGNAGFNDSEADDYTLADASSLKNRSAEVVTLIDIDGVARSNPVSLGAYE